MHIAAKALLLLVAGALFASTASPNPKSPHKAVIKHPLTPVRTHTGGKSSLTSYGANSSHAAPSPGKVGSTGGSLKTVGDNSETAAPSPTGPGFSGTKGNKGGGSGKGGGSITPVGDNSETAAPPP